MTKCRNRNETELEWDRTRKRQNQAIFQKIREASAKVHLGWSHPKRRSDWKGNYWLLRRAFFNFTPPPLIFCKWAFLTFLKKKFFCKGHFLKDFWTLFCSKKWPGNQNEMEQNKYISQNEKIIINKSNELIITLHTIISIHVHHFFVGSYFIYDLAK